MRWLACVLVFVGCYRPSEIASCRVACGPQGECPTGMTCTGGMCTTGETCGSGSGSADAPLGDVAMDDPSALCFGHNAASSFVPKVCVSSVPSTSLMIGGTNIDTTACSIFGNKVTINGVEACVVATQNITITSTVRAYGSRPLVLLASQAVRIDISAVLDATGSHTQAAPGAHPSTCTGGNAGGSNIAGASGGGGGSFRDFGAPGGNGASAAAGNGHNPRTPTTIDGGCNGTAGGSAEANTAGFAGAGGGGVYLVAGIAIVVQGAINASGEGGGGGGAATTMGGIGGGGGGGGAGGFIALDAPNILVSGVLVANGGGGGGGAGVMGNGPGGVGSTPSETAPGTAAIGGPASSSGSGGNGAYLTAVSIHGNDGDSAGGGGGSTGYVYLWSSTTPNVAGSTISPPYAQ